MPTGYTAALIDNPDITFTDFVNDCSKSMGVFYETDSKKLFPMPKKSDYHLTELNEAKKKLNYLKKMTIVRRIAYGQKQINDELISYGTSLAKEVTAFKTFSRMKSEVEQWNPPHVASKLKDFMIEQLVTSMQFDGYTVDGLGKYYVDKINKLLKADPMSVWKADLTEVKRSIKYHQEHYDKDMKSYYEKTDLVNSLARSVTLHQEQINANKSKMRSHG